MPDCLLWEEAQTGRSPQGASPLFPVTSLPVPTSPSRAYGTEGPKSEAHLGCPLLGMYI